MATTRNLFKISPFNWAPKDHSIEGDKDNPVFNKIFK